MSEQHLASKCLISDQMLHMQYRKQCKHLNSTRCAFSAFLLLVEWHEGNPACKNRVVGCWCGCLRRGADLHMAHLLPLPLIVSCSTKSRLVSPFWYQKHTTHTHTTVLRLCGICPGKPG